MTRALARQDAAIGQRLRALPHHPASDRALTLCSQVQEHAGCWLALGLVGAAADKQRRHDWLRATGAVALTELAGQAIKRAVRRPRPPEDARGGRPPTPSRYSFPSAHTAAATAAAMVFPPLVPRAVLLVAAAATGLSRPYLGVHYPSDVIAGVGLGIAVGAAMRGGAYESRRRA
jgi:membrane-associated phospholipid phosphatase